MSPFAGQKPFTTLSLLTLLSLTSALPQGPGATQVIPTAQTAGTNESTLLNPPDCNSYNDIDFWTAGKTKPNICFLNNKHIRFDLTCIDKPINKTTFSATVGSWRAAALMGTEYVDGNRRYQSRCGAQEGKPLDRYETLQTHSTHSSAANPAATGGAGGGGRKNKRQPVDGMAVDPAAAAAGPSSTAVPSGPCTEIRLIEVENSDGQNFTTGGNADLVSTLAGLPGIPLTCRIDVHTVTGVHFGEGCIQDLKKFDPKNPQPCPKIARSANPQDSQQAVVAGMDTQAAGTAGDANANTAGTGGEATTADP